MKRTAGTRRSGWMKSASVGLLAFMILGVAAAPALADSRQGGHSGGSSGGHDGGYGRGHDGGHDGGHGGGGVYFDVSPLWWPPLYAPGWYAPYYPYPRPYPYPYPYYGGWYDAYPPPSIVEEPRVYVEKPQPPPPPTEGYWYYCTSSRAYYPSVQTCPEAWVKVPPRPE